MKDVLIIGGGLAGLRLADILHQTGRDFLLVEARPRIGGRVLTHVDGGSGFDLGPAWFWPGQERMAALAARFGCRVFEQYARGDLRFEKAEGPVQQVQGFAPMQGALRIEGGIGRISDGLASSLPKETLQLSTGITKLTKLKDSIVAESADQATFQARQVVLAIPPRLAVQLAYAPALSPDALQAMQAIPTWMAGQAKALVLYETPFWRDAGLSGDAMSHRGPMVEIHDASPLSDGPFALFGFLGVPPDARKDRAALEAAIKAQLKRLFGPAAETPKALVLQDWAHDPNTAGLADHAPQSAHPQFGTPSSLEDLWDGRLNLGGTEVASEFGGFLEGALAAAENAHHRLLAQIEQV